MTNFCYFFHKKCEKWLLFEEKVAIMKMKFRLRGVEPSRFVSPKPEQKFIWRKYK